MVRHGHAQDPARLVAAREQALAGLDPDMDVAADELEAGVAHQRPRQQPRLGQDLEAVADAEGGHAGLGPAPDLAHDRGMHRHGARAQVVAIGEAAGDDDQVHIVERGVLMPDRERRPPHRPAERLDHVAVPVRAREDDDGGFHTMSLGVVVAGYPRAIGTYLPFLIITVFSATRK